MRARTGAAKASATSRSPETRGPALVAGPPLTPFLQKAREAIRAIPRGTTLSYGTVALVCGVPNGARAVVRALRSLDDVPWWRVCRADGSFAPQCLPLQEELLRQEGWRPRVRKPRAVTRKSEASRSKSD